MVKAGQASLADLLRSYRIEAGLTQEELAERAGVSPQGVSALERGARRRPHRQTITLLAAALGLNTEAETELAGAARPPKGLPRLGGREPLDPKGAPLPVGGFLGALPAGPIVGRDSQLERARAAIQAVHGGEGRVLFLVGEAGIGKTRLAQEVALDMGQQDFLVASGRCYEGHQVVGFYPLLEALTTVYAFSSAAIRAAIPDCWPYLSRLLPEHDLPTPVSSDGVEEQERVFRAVAGFICAVAAEQPVALLVDDLHWGDTASLELLQHLARSTRGSRVLLLGTYRDVEVRRPHPLVTVLAHLQREQLMERIALPPLVEEETGALIAMHIDGGDVSPELTALVHRNTEGNPFFIREVLRGLVDGGDLCQIDDHQDLRRIDRIAVPQSVREAIGERVSRLGDQTQAIMHNASVLGQTFSFEELAGISDRIEPELEDALDDAVAASWCRKRALTAIALIMP
jgi:predicted ATPase/DNA-binding XRE family transcriptional regulator